MQGMLFTELVNADKRQMMTSSLLQMMPSCTLVQSILFTV